MNKNSELLTVENYKEISSTLIKLLERKESVALSEIPTVMQPLFINYMMNKTLIKDKTKGPTIFFHDYKCCIDKLYS